MAESNNKELIYVLVGVGISLLVVVTVLSFLTNRKVERMSWKDENVMQQTNAIQGLGTANAISQIPVSNQPVIYDERVYKMLVDNEQKIHEHLEDVNTNINNLNNNLKSLNYMQYKMSSLNANVPRAGSVNTIHTTNEDKIRQKDFGMI